MRQASRLLSDVQPGDQLYCHIGDHFEVARKFPIRRRGNWEPGASDSYRSYCKRCHRERNGKVSGPLLISGGHTGRRITVPTSVEVQHALSVLKDARAQRRGAQGYVYCISDGTAVKIGYSVKPEARVAELQTGNPRQLTLLGYRKGTENDELALHKRFLSDNVLQEWFRPTTALLSAFGLTWQADRRLAWMKNQGRRNAP